MNGFYICNFKNSSRKQHNVVDFGYLSVYIKKNSLKIDYKYTKIMINHRNTQTPSLVPYF